MKVLSINAVPYGSTAKIMFQITNLANELGHEAICSTGYSSHPLELSKNDYFLIGGFFSKTFHMFCSKLFGNEGSYSKIATKILLKKIRKFEPDIVHIHNIHCWYINYKLFFNYIKKSHCHLVWTFHDCWPFTGHCTHYDIVGCDKWKKECFKCPIYKEYPSSVFDNSTKMFRKKKKLYSNISFDIVAPSHWMINEIKKSFLKNNNLHVINNGIDTSIFKPRESLFRSIHHCENKFIVLGVSFGWGNKKGLDVFVELAKKLPSDFQIVLVGTNAKVEEQLPKNMLSIRSTNNQIELAEIYSAADIFLNPTREDTYPTVNMEAIACGTPVMTFNTGGSPEIISPRTGVLINSNSVKETIDALLELKNNYCFSRETCAEEGKKFEKNNKFLEYIQLYESILKRK